MTASNRQRMARKRCQALGLRMVKRANRFTVYDGSGQAVVCGPLRTVETYLASTCTARRPGPAPVPAPESWAPDIEAYCRHLAAAGQSPNTVRSRYKALARIGRELQCPPASVTTDTLISWFARHGKWKPETRRDYRAAARGFFAWTHRTGRMAHDIGTDLPRVRIPPAEPRPVPEAMFRDALAAANGPVRLMLRLAGEAGLRRGEVATVRTTDVIATLGGSTLVVVGKGGRTRHVPISDSLAEQIRQSSTGTGFLFPGSDNGHLSPHHVGRLVGDALPAGWSMHKLRHRFGTVAHAASGNLLAVQRLLGHSSVATTQRYCAVDDSTVRAAALAATLTPPDDLCTPI